MEKSFIKFGDIEIDKQKFYQNKRRISIKNIDIKVVVPMRSPLVKMVFNIS